MQGCEKRAKDEEDSVCLRTRWNPELIRDVSSATCITSLKHGGNNRWMLAGVVLKGPERHACLPQDTTTYHTL